jgi:signal peptide peptidase-like protein 2B
LDFLGVLVSLLCLRLIMLPSLQVAVMLLGMAFCYGVFFVFVSPLLLFDSSVMEQVAAVGSSSGSADTDEESQQQ